MDFDVFDHHMCTYRKGIIDVILVSDFSECYVHFGNHQCASGQSSTLAYVTITSVLGGAMITRHVTPRRATPRRFGSAVAVFESPLDAKQTARLHTRSGLSATDGAVETAVTRPQATTASTMAKGRGGWRPRCTPAML